jgi:phosphoheptose isomerase
MRAAIICSQTSESIFFKQAVLAKKKLSDKIERFATICLRSLRLSCEIIFAYNRESFADAQGLSNTHFLRLTFDGAPLAPLVFALNKSAISYIGNNYRYDYVFLRQLQEIANLRRGGIAQITTSDDDPNITFVVEQTRKQRLKTEVFYAQGGRKFAAVCIFFCAPPRKQLGFKKAT